MWKAKQVPRPLQKRKTIEARQRDSNSGYGWLRRDVQESNQTFGSLIVHAKGFARYWTEELEVDCTWLTKNYWRVAKNSIRRKREIKRKDIWSRRTQFTIEDWVPKQSRAIQQNAYEWTIKSSIIDQLKWGFETTC